MQLAQLRQLPPQENKENADGLCTPRGAPSQPRASVPRLRLAEAALATSATPPAPVAPSAEATETAALREKLAAAELALAEERAAASAELAEARAIAAALQFDAARWVEGAGGDEALRGALAEARAKLAATAERGMVVAREKGRLAAELGVLLGPLPAAHTNSNTGEFFASTPLRLPPFSAPFPLHGWLHLRSRTARGPPRSVGA